MTTWELDAWTQVTSSASGFINPVIYSAPPAGSQDQVWVEILDSNLVVQGPIQFATLTATLYYNAVGSWSMVVPYSDFLWNIMMAGDFFVNVNWRGLFSFGGKCENPGYTDSIPGSTGGGAAGTDTGPFIMLSGADYLALLANRIVYPTPSAAWSAQTASGADTVTSMALESAIKHYVNNNVGPAALASRKVTPLTLATDQGRGAAVSYSAKFGSGVDLNLLDLIRTLITSSGNGNSMGVSITRNPSTHGLVFDCYVPRNLSGLAWFSRDLGNLTAISFSLTDPTCTDALVQGSGTNFIQQTAAGKTQWNQTEQFNDSSSETVVSNLQATAQQAILAGAAGPTMSATLVETPFLTFGRDYGLGDIVSIEVRPGNVYSDVVTSVALTADPTQTPPLSVVPTVGQNANSTGTDQTVIGQLTKQIQALEKKLATQ
jgi:Siphovirus ReqiPepy6 Gp37-like protein